MLDAFREGAGISARRRVLEVVVFPFAVVGLLVLVAIAAYFSLFADRYVHSYDFGSWKQREAIHRCRRRRVRIALSARCRGAVTAVWVQWKSLYMTPGSLPHRGWQRLRVMAATVLPACSAGWTAILERIGVNRALVASELPAAGRLPYQQAPPDSKALPEVAST